MKINKITLKNYRNHINKIFEFENGINLLLGNNGAGKSSVFEALGIALFDVEPRDKNLKNAVNKDAKFATITIEFTGNDLVDYIIERKIGNQSKFILKEKYGNILSERKDIILKKISELTGIKGKNAKEIFKNVMSAYQNDLVNVFNLSPSQRKELFNKIFDTEIYEKISYSLLFTENKYKSNLEKIEERINVLEEHLSDYDGIEEKADEVDNKIKDLKENISILKKTEKRLEEEKNNIIIEINKIKEIMHLFEMQKTILKNNEDKKMNLEEQIKNAQKSKKILEKTKDGYIIYINSEKQLNELNNSEKKLIQKFETKNTLQKDLIKLENENNLTKEKVKNLSENIENITNDLFNNKNKILELNNLINSYQLEFEKILKKESIYAKERVKFESDFKVYNNIIINLDNIESELEKEKEILELKNRNLNHLNELENKYQIIKEKIEKENNLKLTLEKLNIKIENLKKSKSQLSNGICPILNEKCLNIEEKGGSYNYFKKSISELKKEINKINNEIKSLNNPEKEKIMLEEKRNEIKININTYEHKINEFNEKKQLKEKLLKQKKALEERYTDLFEKEKYLEKISNNIISSKTEINNEIKNLMKQIKDLKKENFDYTEKIRKLQNELDLFKKEIAKNIEKIDKLNILIKEYENIDIELENLRKKKDEIEKTKIKYKRDYEEYIEHKKTAENLEKYSIELSKIIKNIIKIKNKIFELNEEIKKHKILEELEKEKTNLDFNLKEIKNSLINLNSEYSSFENERKNILNRLKEKQEKIKKINTLKKEKKVIEKKYILTKEFRDKIKSMGKYVSSEFTNIISNIATENYRKISGKNEEIIWNSEKEYLVVLRDLIKGDREFSILSGGEQVSVAISIRTALAKFLSKANVYILDEPTINLDEERRIMLAENLKNMLNEIEQVFIVTHDGTFSEMAENIIKL